MFFLLSLVLASILGPPAHASDLELPLSATPPITAKLRLPADLRPGEKLPVLLIFGGFESAGRVLDLLHPDSRIALASFDYPFPAARNLKFPNDLKYLPEAKRLFPETVRGILALTSALKSRPEIDPKRIIIVGASFGSPFAVAAASRDPDIRGVVLVHGFGLIPQTAEHVILRSWLPRYGWLAYPGAWLLSRASWLYLGIENPETDARAIRQDVLMITAANDSFIPRTASDSLWRALLESPARATRILMPTDHLMPGSDRLIDEIIREVERWISSMPSAALSK